MYGESYAFDQSFRDRMEEAHDAAQQRDYSLLRGTVTYRLERLRESWTVEQLAALWGVSVSRVKALCGQGRIQGARRSKHGKGRPWGIQVHRQPDGTYLPRLTTGSRGPAIRLKSELERPKDDIPI